MPGEIHIYAAGSEHTRQLVGLFYREIGSMPLRVILLEEMGMRKDDDVPVPGILLFRQQILQPLHLIRA